MIRLGVVGHRGYERLPDVLARIAALAPSLGLTLRFEPGLAGLPSGAAQLQSPDDADALLSLGGDGTLLRAARLVAGREVPILGVNLGRLGFLTGCGPDELESALERFAVGDYESERRMTLDARLRAPDGRERERWFAMNDVVLHKGGLARMVRLHLSADGESVASYAADGVVLSTPTGSTAYALSAGGPVVVPTIESLLVTPIAAHTLAIRPLLLPPTTELIVRSEDAPEALLVTVDGQVGTTFARDEELVVRRGAHAVIVVRFAGSNFFTTMRRKLGWGGLQERDEAR